MRTDLLLHIIYTRTKPQLLVQIIKLLFDNLFFSFNNRCKSFNNLYNGMDLFHFFKKKVPGVFFWGAPWKNKKVFQKVFTTITIETNSLSIWPAPWRWNLFNRWENEWTIISAAESTDISMNEWKDRQNNYYKVSEKGRKKESYCWNTKRNWKKPNLKSCTWEATVLLDRNLEIFKEEKRKA